jgi:leader peptidase (prepilin peptidase) / N-methyltransferase
MELFLYNAHALYALAIVIGLIVGSFLNVVVYRLPRILERTWRTECAEFLGTNVAAITNDALSLSHPASHCPHCGHLIRPWENIPVLSYILLRGRCAACTAPISLRYPLVELTAALLSLAVVMHFGPTWQSVAALILTWSLLTLGLIDYDTQLLPDAITLPLVWLGLLLSLGKLFTDPTAAILGAAMGYLILWGVFQAFRLTTGKEGMGYGDFKLLAVLGAWMGWQYLPQIIILSACVGAIAGTGLILLRGRDKNLPIPFGPYLAAAGWVSLLWGDALTQAYQRWAGLI